MVVLNIAPRTCHSYKIVYVFRWRLCFEANFGRDGDFPRDDFPRRDFHRLLIGIPSKSLSQMYVFWERAITVVLRGKIALNLLIKWHIAVIWCYSQGVR